jgi:predicted DsbA family dithiol-disulfide isomerase
MTLADSVEIPRDSLRPCLTSHRMRARVANDAATASHAGARATPTFYIDGALVSGAYPVQVFRHILDSIYAVRRGPAR